MNDDLLARVDSRIPAPTVGLKTVDAVVLTIFVGFYAVVYYFFGWWGVGVTFLLAPLTNQKTTRAVITLMLVVSLAAIATARANNPEQARQTVDAFFRERPDCLPYLDDMANLLETGIVVELDQACELARRLATKE